MTSLTRSGAVCARRRWGRIFILAQRGEGALEVVQQSMKAKSQLFNPSREMLLETSIKSMVSNVFPWTNPMIQGISARMQVSVPSPTCPVYVTVPQRSWWINVLRRPSRRTRRWSWDWAMAPCWTWPRWAVLKEPDMSRKDLNIRSGCAIFCVLLDRSHNKNNRFMFLDVFLLSSWPLWLQRLGGAAPPNHPPASGFLFSKPSCCRSTTFENTPWFADSRILKKKANNANKSNQINTGWHIGSNNRWQCVVQG